MDGKDLAHACPSKFSYFLNFYDIFYNLTACSLFSLRNNLNYATEELKDPNRFVAYFRFLLFHALHLLNHGESPTQLH